MTILWRFNGNQEALKENSKRYEDYKAAGILPCIAVSASNAITESKYFGKIPSSSEQRDIEQVQQHLKGKGLTGNEKTD